MVNVENLLLLGLLPLEAIDKALESSDHLVAMVKSGVRERRGIDTKEEHVDDDISSSEEWRRVLGVLLGVEEASLVGGSGDVVQVAGVIVDAIRVDGQVAGVVDVAIPNRQDDPHGGKGTEEAIDGAEEGHHERIS